LESGESWRRLNDHPSTKAENLQDFLPIVEGRPFLVKQQDGSVKQAANMGSDGIAISSRGLYYYPLASRRLYSVSTQALTVKSVCVAAVTVSLTGRIFKSSRNAELTEQNTTLKRQSLLNMPLIAKYYMPDSGRLSSHVEAPGLNPLFALFSSSDLSVITWHRAILLSEKVSTI
jgi:hypothetical protein